jgi:hypothetical protein
MTIRKALAISAVLVAGMTFWAAGAAADSNTDPPLSSGDGARGSPPAQSLWGGVPSAWG